MHKELIGKTISKASIKKHMQGCDSKNMLFLEMTDGSIFEIVGGYAGYTGKSCDEYQETIDIEKLK